MSNNNHEEQEGELRKACPFLGGKWCLGDSCALRPQLNRVVNGVPQSVRVCWADAVVILLSELNARTVPPQQKVQLPGLYRAQAW